MISPLQARNADGRGAAPPDRRPILVVPYMWIGDFVRCHSVVKLLKARYPARPVDVLSTTLCAPLADYMPELRQAIVVDLPRKRLSYGEHAALAQRLKRENYGTALIMPRTWKAALAPFLAGIPERVGWLGEWRFGLLNDLRFGEKQRPRMIDQCAALALPEGRPAPHRMAPARAARAAHRDRGLARADGLARRAAGRGARARRGRPVEALAGLRLCRGRAASDRRGRRGLGGRRPGREAARGRNRRRRRPARARPHRHRSAQRDPRARGVRRRGLERFGSAACRGRARHARRSAFSGRPVRGTGRRSIRSPRPCRPRRSSTASPATSRPAARAITAACATSRPNRFSR